MAEGSHVYILGAGASRGSEIPEANPKLIPVMDGFIKCGLDSVSRDAYAPLLNLLKKRYRYDPDLGAKKEEKKLSFEEIFSQVQLASSSLWKPEFRWSAADEFEDEAFRFADPADWLISFIFETLCQTTGQFLAKGTCRLHDALVDTLSEGDTLISLNYDLIADASLRSSGKWHEQDGYGTGQLLGDQAGRKKSPFHLLKLHGSLNWRLGKHRATDAATAGVIPFPLDRYWLQVLPVSDVLRKPALLTAHGHDSSIRELASSPRISDGGRAELSSIGYPSIQSGLLPFIVPPTLFKSMSLFEESWFRCLWREAFEALRGASRITVIGCQLRAEDLHLTTLLRESQAHASKGPVDWDIALGSRESSEKLGDRLCSAGIIKSEPGFYASLEDYARKVCGYAGD